MNGQQPIAIQIVRAAPHRYDNYYFRGARALGALQIFLGVASIVTNIAAIVIGAEVSYSGYGFYSAIFWIIAGSFGLASSSYKTKCLIITTMVMSIISAVTLTFYVILNIVQFTVIDDDYSYDHDAIDWDVCGCHDFWDEPSNSTQTMCVNCAVPRTAEENADEWAVTSVQAAIGVAELVVAIVAAALCCHAVCCCRSAHVAHTPSAGSQYVVVNTQQGPCPLTLPPGYQLAGPSQPQSTAVNMSEASAGKSGLPPSGPANPSPPPPYTRGAEY